MRSFVTSLALLGLSHAYPSINEHLAAQDAKGNVNLKKRVPFDAASQYISTSGEYAFVPPTSTDQRGPCPGLNAMANHGYLPHNGIATITQIIEANTKGKHHIPTQLSPGKTN
jgi:hypothetical protein